MPHIIDGHNLIGAGLLPGIRLGDADDELRLLEQLRAYRARGGPEMVVFFDSGGYATIGAPTLRVAGLEVRFSAVGEIADDAIIAYLKQQHQPGQFTVVTNDSALTQRARFVGANAISAQQFTRGMATGGRRKPSSISADPERPTPAAKDPGFVDIYATFVEVEQGRRYTKGVVDAEFDAWVADLLSDDVSIAQKAAERLGLSRRAEAEEPLRVALLHEAPGVRAAAALALGALGAQAALGDLVNRLQADDNSMVRDAAAQSLGRIGNRSVESALETAAREDRKAKVRKTAQAALGQIRARRG